MQRILEGPQVQQKTKTQLIVAVGVMQNNLGELLINQRHQPELPDAHRRWELPGGSVEYGEHPAEVVVDTQRTLVRSTIWSYLDRDAYIVPIAYQGTVIGGERRVQGGKVIDVRWCRPETLPRDNFLPLVIEFIEGFAKERSHGPQ